MLEARGSFFLSVFFDLSSGGWSGSAGEVGISGVDKGLMKDLSVSLLIFV